MDEMKYIIFHEETDPWANQPQEKLQLYINENYAVEQENPFIDIKRLYKRICIGDAAAKFLQDAIDSAVYGIEFERSLLCIGLLEDQESLDLFIGLVRYLQYTDDPTKTLSRIYKMKRPELYIIEPGPDDEQAIQDAIKHLQDLN